MRISDWSSDVCSSDLWAPPSPGCRCPPPAERSTDFRRHNGGAMTQLDETVNVRYMVDDVEAAVAFYTEHFGRAEERRVGKEGVSTGRSRWSRNHQKKNKTTKRHTGCGSTQNKK